MEISTIGIDLGKTTFHVIGLDARGEIVLRKKFSRKQLLVFTANRRQILIGTEACGGAHHLARALREQGHDVRLMPAQYVKPYVKTNKNDYLDAEAIAEAVQRPTMRFVPIKTDAQLDLQALHRVRDRWVARRTAVMNQIRGFLLERGIRLTGTDAWSWDAPFYFTAQKWAKDHDPSIIWEGHKAGRDIGYCHLEKLHNLEALPGHGFTIACFPHKIRGASAGWTRAVAIFEE